MCDKHFTADIKLRIRNGVNLLFGEDKWLVSYVSDYPVIIDGPLLDTIGCSNRYMLFAACDRNNGVIISPDSMRQFTETNKHSVGVASIIKKPMGVYQSVRQSIQ